MIRIIKDFFKNKFNIILAIVQSLAIISLVLGSFVSIFMFIFFGLEGLFFVVWGIKELKEIRLIENSRVLYEKLPLSSEEIEYLKKKSTNETKSSKSKGRMLLILGTVLIITLISILF